MTRPGSLIGMAGDWRQDGATARWIAAMRRGDQEAAWTTSDEVLAARDPRTRDDRRLPYHRRWVWDGTPLGGRDVLVRCYHGLGDTLQFSRFLSPLARVAASVVVEAQPCLLPLLQASGLGAAFVPFAPEQPHPASDAVIEIMELSHALRLPPLAVAPPYLRLPGREIDPQGERLAAGTPVAAICWRAGGWDEERSLPLAALAACFPRGWRFALLQPDACAEERCAAPFLNAEARLERIIDTAALIVGADLVVTVDTMVAHLAGALGRPGMVLLKRDADWRWESGSRSSWYPTLRLFRQTLSGDWQGALCALRAALAFPPAD